MADQPQQPPVTDKIKAELNKIPPTNDRNLMAALSYVWILSLVMLVMKKDDPFIHGHAKQALVLFLVSLVSFIPVVGWIIGFLCFIGMVLGFINAWQGKEFQLPFISEWAKKINF